MLVCKRCGYYNSDASARCEQCDRRLSSASAEPVRRYIETDSPHEPKPDGPKPVPTAYVVQPVYAGFWVRGAALFIDGIVVSFGSAFTSPFLPGIFSVAVLLFGALYEILMEAQTGATLGKKALGLRVTTPDGQPISIRRSIGRHFAHYLSAIFFIGYIMAGFDRQKRALHDRMAGTLVIKET